MGKVSAAAVAVGLGTSFPNTKIALVVGICGGVSSGPKHKREVYLGDVILGESVDEYDFGRQYPAGFEPKSSSDGASGAPPAALQAVLRRLQLDYHCARLEELTPEFLQAIQAPEEGYAGGQKKRSYACPGYGRTGCSRPGISIDIAMRVPGKKKKKGLLCGVYMESERKNGLIPYLDLPLCMLTRIMKIGAKISN